MPLTSPSPRGLYRSRQDAVFFGVCGGLAERFDVSPLALRILTVVLSLFTSGFFALLYLILACVLKPAPLFSSSSLPGDDLFRAAWEGSRADALRLLQDRFQALDRRLQRLESIVTDPAFDLEDQVRRL